MASQRQSFRFDWILQRSNGQDFWTDVHTSKASIDGAQVLLVVIRDISMIKKLEENLRLLNGELEQFVQIASHDLQEPVRTLVSFTDLLRDEHQTELSREARQYLHFVIAGGKRIKAMVDALLAYSHLTSKPMQKIEFEIDNIAQNVVASLNELIIETDTKIDCKVQGTITGDPSLLFQLLQHLLINAIKFKNQGTPVQIGIYSETNQSDTVVRVRDNGLGIKPIYFQKIFEVFKRLHSSSDIEGVGMGLAICKKIIDLHGGRIWVESTFGEGSMFSFTIPKNEKKSG